MRASVWSVAASLTVKTIHRGGQWLRQVLLSKLLWGKLGTPAVPENTSNSSLASIVRFQRDLYVPQHRIKLFSDMGLRFQRAMRRRIGDVRSTQHKPARPRNACTIAGERSVNFRGVGSPLQYGTNDPDGNVANLSRSANAGTTKGLVRKMTVDRC